MSEIHPAAAGGDFAARLAAPTPTPGGGAAAAQVALFAVSLARMVAGITLKKLASEGPRAELEAALRRGEELDAAIRGLEQDDVAAFEGYLAALRLPRDSDEQRTARQAARRDAAVRCAEVPLALLEKIAETRTLTAELRALGERVRLRAASDLPVAEVLAAAAFDAARHTLEANLGELTPELAARISRRADELRASV